MRRRGNAFGSVLDVASICELMGIYSNVAVMVVSDHGNGGSRWCRKGLWG